MLLVRRAVSIACVSGVCVGFVAAAGCKRHEPGTGAAADAGVTTTTGAEVRIMTESATERMARARCSREVSCDHVGPGRRHASIETCRELNQSESRAELNPQACPGGIDQSQLVRCIAAMEQASCLDPVGAIVRDEECRTHKLCVKGERR
jgi:Family of unknown function (DUF6184)